MMKIHLQIQNLDKNLILRSCNLEYIILMKNYKFVKQFNFIIVSRKVRKLNPARIANNKHHLIINLDKYVKVSFCVFCVFRGLFHLELYYKRIQFQLLLSDRLFNFYFQLA